MVISETLLVDEEPSRSQLTMPAYAVSALQSGRIKKMTKGMVAYECLMLAHEEYKDSLQDIRIYLLDELEGEVSGLSVRDELKKIILAVEEDGRGELVFECSFEDPMAKIDHVEVWLPASMEREFTRKRYIGELISDAIVYAVASPWSGRTELINDLIDLLELARGGEPEEPSQFVIDVMTGRSNTYHSESLQPLHEAVMGDSPFQPLDRDGKRTDVDESVDGVPAWASEYDWEAVGLEPSSSVDFIRGKELISSVKQTPKQRVPIAFVRANRYAEDLLEAGENPVVQPVWVAQAVKLLFKNNDDVEMPSEATLERYASETIELMRASSFWEASPLKQAFEAGIELPEKLLDIQTVRDANGKAVKGDDGSPEVSVSLKHEYDVFEYVPDGESSLLEQHREILESVKEQADARIKRIEAPSKTGINFTKSGADIRNINSFELQIECAEATLEWFNEQFK